VNRIFFLLLSPPALYQIAEQRDNLVSHDCPYNFHLGQLGVLYQREEGPDVSLLGNKRGEFEGEQEELALYEKLSEDCLMTRSLDYKGDSLEP
jgi:hypothetical protein